MLLHATLLFNKWIKSQEAPDELLHAIYPGETDSVDAVSRSDRQMEQICLRMIK